MNIMVEGIRRKERVNIGEESVSDEDLDEEEEKAAKAAQAKQAARHHGAQSKEAAIAKKTAQAEEPEDLEMLNKLEDTNNEHA